jgi:benzylsuccinate CoA-transferase BbsE subunit
MAAMVVRDMANGAPLSGFRVLDCTDELGVYAGKLLLQLGAEVVRLEPPGGDPMRRYPPLAGDGGRAFSLYHAHFNAGKRSVTLDLETVDGRERLGRLVGSAHALIESSVDAATLLSARVGVDWLRAARPDLVLVSITPFGLTGPRREHTGGDLVVAARSGLLWLSGRPDGPPHRPGGEQAAHMAGLAAANAALLGLVDQARTGQGCHLEVPASFAATLATLQTANANYYTWHGRVPVRRGFAPPANRHIYPAADGWVALTPLPGQWEKFTGWLAEHDAAADLADPAYAEAAQRMAAAEHINDVIIAFTSRYPKQYLLESGQRAGVACAPVNQASDLAADPFLRERGWLRAVHEPALGREVEYPGPPVRFVTGEEPPSRPVAPFGADNQAIWVEELGMAAETVAVPGPGGAV